MTNEQPDRHSQLCSESQESKKDTEQSIKSVVAELVGSFAFIFLGAGSVITNALTHDSIGLLGIALAHGLAGSHATLFSCASRCRIPEPCIRKMRRRPSGKLGCS